MTNYDKLINTLKEVFMLDKAELDFGIYRIMNQKRKDIEQFLEVDLVPQVKEILKSSQTLDAEGIKRKLDSEIETARKYGNANPEELPQVKELKAQYLRAGDLTAIENEVFSLLSNFFKRYFDNGDFISMRRYKKDVYAIPYEGEEVKLHWANADQYYIKTSEYFKVYRFKLANGKTVAFELIEASTEQNNNKTQGDKERRFAIYTDKVCEVVGDEFKIYFIYEQIDKGVTQSDLLEVAFDTIVPLIPEGFKIELLRQQGNKNRKKKVLKKGKDGQEKKVDVEVPTEKLFYHLRDYTARNTFDYFIHKDLGGFLTRELDFYIKNEVLFIDDLNTRDEQEFLKQLSKIKAIKKIGEKIITFLAQLENFQKKLWLKKKMVVECNYCITLDRVPKDLYTEIISNDAQIKEWIKLFAIDEIKAQESGGLFPENKFGFSNPLTLEFLNQNQFLVLDTAFFSEGFKWKLIGSIENFDEQCDGLLINSENFQALSLLQKRYEGQVQCTYIDPPYNTDGDGFTYKDSFRHSSWIAMMNDRLTYAKYLTTDDAVLFQSIGNEEVSNLKMLTTSLYGDKKEHNVIHWKKNQKPQNASSTLSESAEYVLVFFGDKPIKLVRPMFGTREDERGSFKPTPLFTFDGRERRTQVIPKGIIVETKIWKKGKLEGARNKLAYIEILDEPIIIDGKLINDVRVHGEWRKTETNGEYQKVVKDLRLFINSNGFPNEKSYRDDNSFNVQTNLWLDAGYNEMGKATMDALFGVSGLISYPKPIELIKEIVKCIGNNNALIIDYFAGSGTTGHAIIETNREDEDEGNRNYILVEMSSYFDTVTKPRIQKVIYSKDWKDGKPVSREGISHCFKYMRLESYEDTLNNLALKQTETQQTALKMNPNFKEGYMLNYMLDVESKESLLNLEWFVNPFNFFLNITKNNELQPTKVDLVETFNYLIGLKVGNYAVPKEGYVVVIGKNLAGESILVVWRDCTQHNSIALNQFLKESKYNPLVSEYDRIYVNGDNNVENLKTGDERWKVVLIEEEFGKRMFDQN